METPFEQATVFVNSLAERLYAAYALQKSLPVLEQLEAQAPEAYQLGDSRLVADIQVIMDSLNQQFVQLSFEA